jgi:hypothetical protein
MMAGDLILLSFVTGLGAGIVGVVVTVIAFAAVAMAVIFQPE